MGRGIRIALVAVMIGVLGTAAGVALGSNGSAGDVSVGGASLRLVATATKTGVVVKAIGSGKISFSVSGGLRPARVSPTVVRIEGVEIAKGGGTLRLIARASNAPRPVILGLNKRKKQTPTTTTSLTTTTVPKATSVPTTTVRTPTTPTTSTVRTPTTTPTTTTTTTATATTTATTTTTTTTPPPPPVRGAAAPSTPTTYTVPAGATTVSTSDALATELAKPAHDIVLADGDYTASAPFSNPNGNRVYAAHLGQAVLHVGITLGGNYGTGGGLLQGLTFDVSSSTVAPDNAIVDLWGAAGVNNTVLDTTFDGHNVVGYAIRDTTPEGFTVRRIVARNFTSDGISVDSYPDVVTFVHPPVLTDIDVANVSRPVPKSSNGTSEACVWLGTQVTLMRAKLRNCAWMGLWTGFNGTGSTYSDIDVDNTPTGVYMEHFTTSSTFRNLHVGTGVRTGVNCEWADPAWGGKPASVDNVIQDSLIESSYVGVYMDEGTTHTTVQNTTFRGQTGAAIDDYKGIGNSYTGNDYTGVSAGGVAISTAHL